MIQPTLFSNIAAVTRPVRTRQSVIDAAFKGLTSELLKAYADALVEYAKTHEEFTGEDVTAYFLTVSTLRPKKDFRAMGGLFQRFIRARIIEDTGRTARRKNSSKTAIYRSLVRG